MRIDTKYDVGQTVHVITYRTMGWHGWDNDGPIEVLAVYRNKDGLFYEYIFNGFPSIATEDCCFPTNEDAQTECDRRNRNGEKP